MTERRITVENAYTQQNYLIQLCMGYTDRLNELEAKYHKMQAENWHHQTKQLKSANRALHNKVDALQRHLTWYRGKVIELKAENQRLRDRLQRHQELEQLAKDLR